MIERGMLMKKFAITATSIFKKIFAFVTKVLGMFKFSITFKMPFINVTLALSIFQSSIGGFLFYLPPALPNSFALYSGAMTCKR
jgi:hypothetical protein